MQLKTTFIFTLCLIVCNLLSFHAVRADNKSNINFVENKNQWDTQVLFKADLTGRSRIFHLQGLSVCILQYG
jgi:hypothetical protein